MTTETSGGHQSGGVAEAKEKAGELVSSAQEQASTIAHELGGQASFQVREQLDQRSTQTGEQVQSVGKVLHSGANQLRSEGNDLPAKLVEQIAQRADAFGDYLQTAQADRILDDVEQFARRRPWLTAGAGVLAGFMASRFVKASGERRHAAHGNGQRRTSQKSLTAGSA